MITSVSDTAVQADRMWERLLELALFVRSNGRHRKPSEILKTFIKGAGPDSQYEQLSKDEKRKLTAAFSFLAESYKNSTLGSSRLATDQTHFYTLATSLITGDLLVRFESDILGAKLLKFARAISQPPIDRPEDEVDPLRNAISRYRDLSTEKTTDASRRKERQQKFVEALELL